LSQLLNYGIRLQPKGMQCSIDKLRIRQVCADAADDAGMSLGQLGQWCCWCSTVEVAQPMSGDIWVLSLLLPRWQTVCRIWLTLWLPNVIVAHTHTYSQLLFQHLLLLLLRWHARY